MRHSTHPAMTNLVFYSTIELPMRDATTLRFSWVYLRFSFETCINSLRLILQLWLLQRRMSPRFSWSSSNSTSATTWSPRRRNWSCSTLSSLWRKRSLLSSTMVSGIYARVPLLQFSVYKYINDSFTRFL